MIKGKSEVQPRETCSPEYCKSPWGLDRWQGKHKQWWEAPCHVPGEHHGILKCQESSPLLCMPPIPDYRFFRTAETYPGLYLSLSFSKAVFLPTASGCEATRAGTAPPGTKSNLHHPKRHASQPYPSFPKEEQASETHLTMA